MAAPVTLQGAGLSMTTSGLLTIVINAELQRRHINMDPQELMALMGLLAPTLHTSARVIQAVTRTFVKRWTGVDIEENGQTDVPLGAPSQQEVTQ